MGAKESAADRRGPLDGEIFVFASATTSAVKDVGTAYTNRNIDFALSRYVRIISDQPIFYKWSHNPAATVDETATSGATQADSLPAGECREERPAGRYFVFKLAAAGTPGLVRISVVESEPITGMSRSP